MTETEVIEIVARHAGLTPEQILSKQQQADVALARYSAIYFCRQYIPIYSVSTVRLGKAFNRNHTGVTRALQKAEYDPSTKAFIRQCESEIKAKAETARMQVPNG